MSHFIRFELPYLGDRNAPLGAALRHCEVYCVAMCCGMDAFDETCLQTWADRASDEDIACARRQVEEVLTILKDAPERFFFLNREQNREKVTQWVESIRATLATVKPARESKEH